MQIHERIRKLRKEILKLTQEEFALKINMSRSNLGSIEIGRINITDRVIKDICLQYGINEYWLKTGEGEIFQSNIDNKVSLLLDEFELGEYGKGILEIYLSLSLDQKKAINSFLKKFIEKYKNELSEK